MAGGTRRVQASLFASYAGGHEMRNRGSRATEDATRTKPNPQDRQGVQALGKVTFALGAGNLLRGSVEYADTEVDTIAYSSRSLVVQGPIVTDVSDVRSNDTMHRIRVSVDQAIDNRAGMNHWAWSLYAQNSDTGQVVDEVRTTAGIGPSTTLLRSGTLDYEQRTLGGSLQARKRLTPGGRAVLLTMGGTHKRDVFDMIRDRVDVNASTGAIVPATGIILPSKYFPKSIVDESGAYLQGEVAFGPLTLIPGLRYDRFKLDAGEADRVYIDNDNPIAADFSADRVSARVGATMRVNQLVSLHAQYAGGFRAPPYNAVNSGFTNLAGGYAWCPCRMVGEKEATDGPEHTVPLVRLRSVYRTRRVVRVVGPGARRGRRRKGGGGARTGAGCHGVPDAAAGRNLVVWGGGERRLAVRVRRPRRTHALLLHRVDVGTIPSPGTRRRHLMGNTARRAKAPGYESRSPQGRHLQGWRNGGTQRSWRAPGSALGG